MHAKHVLYVRTRFRTLQAGIENINSLIKNLTRLLRKILGSFMWVSTVFEERDSEVKTRIRGRSARFYSEVKNVILMSYFSWKVSCVS